MAQNDAIAIYFAHNLHSAAFLCYFFNKKWCTGVIDASIIDLLEKTLWKFQFSKLSA